MCLVLLSSTAVTRVENITLLTSHTEGLASRRTGHQPQRHQHGGGRVGLGAVWQLLLLPLTLPLRQLLPGQAKLPQHQAHVREGAEAGEVRSQETAGQLLLT